MFLKKAMRYYRVWIYSCNLVLLLSTMVFLILSIWITTDYQMGLLPTIKLYHPSILYGYLAVLLQGGVLQAIGCMGAVRMNERLLNLYWQLLVALLVGDVIVGFVWLFRYNNLLINLRSDLKYRLYNEYGSDDGFDMIWDRVQREYQCCGVDGPYDYNMTTWLANTYKGFGDIQPPLNSRVLVPNSCCRLSSFTSSSSTSPLAAASSLPYSSVSSSLTSLSAAFAGTTSSSSSGLLSSTSNGHRKTMGLSNSLTSGDSGNPGGTPTGDNSCVETYSSEKIFVYGCYDSVLKWLQRSANILCVLGFCVISFLKLCFACILRYEIKEMIQKIQVLKGSADCEESPLHELEAYLPRPSVQQDSQQTLLTSQSPQSNPHRHRHSTVSQLQAPRTERLDSNCPHYGSNKHLHAPCGGPPTANPGVKERCSGQLKSTNGNNNEIKKQSLV